MFYPAYFVVIFSLLQIFNFNTHTCHSVMHIFVEPLKVNHSFLFIFYFVVCVLKLLEEVGVKYAQKNTFVRRVTFPKRHLCTV